MSILLNPAALQTPAPYGAELFPWINAGLKLERPHQSVRHRLEESGLCGSMGDTQTFVIQNNWAAAFSGAGDFDSGAFVLPYPVAWFEFRISGRPVLIEAEEAPELPSKILFQIFVEAPNGWTTPGDVCTLDEFGGNALFEDMDPRFRPLIALMGEQMRAVCICLEAGVADTETVDAPDRLNKARKRRGRTTLADYQIVRLSHRHRHGDVGDGAGTRKRLHFRRGHWRHLVERKTWVRWTLVGNPDLGFVDKEYRL